jgi:hypothetical protein
VINLLRPTTIDHKKDDSMSVIGFLIDRHHMVAVVLLGATCLFAFCLVSSAVNFPKEKAIPVLKEFVKELLGQFHSAPSKNPLSIRSTSTNTQGAASGLELSRSGTPKF